ncbi:MAG: carboxypeptidase regulatory-like domain-containing protein [Pirellulales bacterium]|nr:carboxypeptidase regulatory-like domain-containing protein [Pirellulales bacterium]
MRLSLRHLPVWLAMIGMCLPQTLLGAQPAKPVANDVKLWKGGTMLGQVVDAQGQPIPETIVTLRDSKGNAVAAKTDPRGYFTFQGLKSGAYSVSGAGAEGAYRAWTESVAPPSAQPGVLLVEGNEVLRGQQPLGAFIAQHPILIAGIVAAAIAIPIAVHNANDDDEPGSP